MTMEFRALRRTLFLGSVFLASVSASAGVSADQIANDLCFDVVSEGVRVNGIVAQKLQSAEKTLNVIEGSPNARKPGTPLYLFAQEKLDQGVRGILRGEGTRSEKYSRIEALLNRNGSRFPTECRAMSKPIADSCRGEAYSESSLAACEKRELGPPGKGSKIAPLLETVVGYSEFEKRVNARP